MNINLVIDQLVLEGMTLSRGERVELEESFRETLVHALHDRAATRAFPKGRSAQREQMLVFLSETTGGAGLGKSLGASLGSHVWNAQAPQTNGQGERR